MAHDGSPIATEAIEDCVDLLVQFLGTTRYAESVHQDEPPYSSGVDAFRQEAAIVGRTVLERLDRSSREAARLREVLATLQG